MQQAAELARTAEFTRQQLKETQDAYDAQVAAASNPVQLGPLSFDFNATPLILGQLEERINELTVAAESAEQGATRLTQAVEAGQYAAFDAAAAQEELNKTYEEGVKTAAKLSLEIRQVAAASEAKVAEIKAKRDGDILKTETEAAAARIKLTDDAEIQRNRLIEDSNERIRKATALAANALLTATGERDALAAFMAAQHRDEVIDEEKRSRSINERRLKEDLNRSIALNREAEKKKLAEQRAAAQASINMEVTQANARLTVLRNQHAIEMMMLNQLSTVVTTTVNNVNRSLSALFANFGTPPVINLGPDFSQFGTPPSINLGSTSNPFDIRYTSAMSSGIGFLGGQGLASGLARVPHDMVTKIHKDEAVLKVSDARIWRGEGMRNGGGATFPITVNGNNLSRREVVSIAAEELNGTLKAAGWK